MVRHLPTNLDDLADLTNFHCDLDFDLMILRLVFDVIFQPHPLRNHIAFWILAVLKTVLVIKSLVDPVFWILIPCQLQSFLVVI